MSLFSPQICAIGSIARKKAFLLQSMLSRKKEAFCCYNQSMLSRKKEAFRCYNQSMLSRKKEVSLVVATMRSITPSVDKVREKAEEDCLRRSLICQLLQLSFSLSLCFAQFCFLSLRSMFQRILMEITREENQNLRPKNLKTLKRNRDSKAISFDGR